MSKLVEHHIKYKEIHGVDETVWMTNSEHQKLHHRLRKEGKCNVSVDDLTKISISAHERTIKRIEYIKQYYHNHCDDMLYKQRIYYHNNRESINKKRREQHQEHGISACRMQYNIDNKDKIAFDKKNYLKNNIQYFNFYESPGQYIKFHERILYNHATGNIGYLSLFRANNNKFLPIIDI